MRFIKQQLALWRIVLIIGMTAIAIPIAARFSPTALAIINEQQEYLGQETRNNNEDRVANHSNSSKAGVGQGIERPQDYYDRRRQYWEDRVDRRLEREDEETGDEEDAKDSKDSKDAADEDDADDPVDKEQDIYERRREYWRQRVEREW
jgi:hypothetical protein